MSLEVYLEQHGKLRLCNYEPVQYNWFFNMKNVLYFLILNPLLMAGLVFSVDTFTPKDAISHIGQQATVCGNVSSKKFSSRSKKQPTFINLSRLYPKQIFTIFMT